MKLHCGLMLQDLNIGVALWLAASGDGWVSERPSTNSDENQQRLRYKSEARIVLVGSGADEQCAGYGRHRTKYRCGGYGFNMYMLTCGCCHSLRLCLLVPCSCSQPVLVVSTL